MTCPYCNGRKGGVALARPAKGDCFEIFVPCEACEGTGDISESLAAELANYKAQGDWLRRERLAEPYENLKAVADRWGIGVAHYSGLEMGRAKAWREQLAAQDAEGAR